MASDTLYYGGSQYFNESTGSYTNGFVPDKTGSDMGFGGSTTTNSSISATPSIPLPLPTMPSTAVKPATPDLIQFNDSEIPIEFMTDLLFENIGGQEILSMSRSDLVNGQRVIYSPIKNLTQVGQDYSPQNLFMITDSSSSYFNNYSINLQARVPEIGSNAAEGEVLSIIYVEATTGDLFVNLINMRLGEQVEVQLLNHGSQLGDIIN